MADKGKKQLDVNFVCYADDAFLQIKGQNIDEMFNYASELLLEVIKWSKTSGLVFNAAKTKVMVVHRYRHPCQNLPNLRFPNDLEGDFTEITPISQMRYRGVILDEKLSFLPHFKFARDKTNSVFNNLCRVIKQDWGLDLEKVMFLYKACVQPMLLYGAEIWGHRMEAVKTNKNLLLSSQRRILLRATRAYRTTSTSALMAICNSPPIHLIALMKYRLRKEINASLMVQGKPHPKSYPQLEEDISSLLSLKNDPADSAQEECVNLRHG
jgi:hypothetical protein